MGCYRALILDFDGTLAATLEDVVWCMGQTFQSFGLPAPPSAAVQATMGLPLEDALRLLSQDQCRSAEQEWVRAYREIYRMEGGHRTALFPGAVEVLASAQGRGVRTMVVSNKGVAALRSHLARLHLLSSVDVILGGDSVPCRKPDPQLYRAEMSPRLAGIRDQEVLVVGDTETDLKFANGAGLDSCWASYGYGNLHRCLDLRPSHVINSMYELEPLLA